MVFNPDQLVQLKQFSLSRVLCDSGDTISRVQKDVFSLVNSEEEYLSCSDIPKIDLKMWSDCCMGKTMTSSWVTCPWLYGPCLSHRPSFVLLDKAFFFDLGQMFVTNVYLNPKVDKIVLSFHFTFKKQNKKSRLLAIKKEKDQALTDGR